MPIINATIIDEVINEPALIQGQLSVLTMEYSFLFSLSWNMNKGVNTGLN